eukprot:CAMPEP_0169167444 /NCGR_PEP_ID=MMETSP1015-20121227/60480_1 /TAXON_ID=342587 /ORGANISM="Karlodinium micrum, Strain CCMP2283" /LENGTH=98 /DNA_ID=CAMNT_0009240165 /DNA_START=321 /DNA_END=617 /DNA_ORIENTATION=+
MTRFLQQCIKGREDVCAHIWGSLRERERKDLLQACTYSDKAMVFFTKIAEPDDHELPDVAGEDWASESGSSLSWSRFGRESTCSEFSGFDAASCRQAV